MSSLVARLSVFRARTVLQHCARHTVDSLQPRSIEHSFSFRLLKTMTSGNDVKHDTDHKAFYMQIQEDHVAKLEYDWVREGVIDFYHTEVPSVYRGMGLAKLLAKAALDYAVAKDAKIILSCSYLAKYVADNPEPEYTSRLLVNSKS